LYSHINIFVAIQHIGVVKLHSFKHFLLQVKN